MPEVSEDAVQRAAEVMLRQYDGQYSAGHLTWRDFADDAREILAATLMPVSAEPAERPPYGQRVPEDCELVAVPDPEWRLVDGKRCRRQGGFHKVCGEMAVAEFRRAHGNYWAYCPDHMYGRWVEHGRVMHWILQEKGGCVMMAVLWLAVAVGFICFAAGWLARGFWDQRGRSGGWGHSGF